MERAPKRPTRRREAPSDGEQTTREIKDRIHEAALRLFAEKGFHAVSVRDICRNARTTLPMVYYYYGSKKGLHDALLEESVERRISGLQAAQLHEGDVVTRLRLVLQAWAAPDEANLPRDVQMFYVRELTGLGAGLNAELVDRIDRELRQALRNIVQDGIQTGLFRPVKVPMVVLAMIGIINTFRRRMVLGARVSLDDGIEQVTDTLLHGILAVTDPSVATATSEPAPVRAGL
jgi:AcrR family transcriptional regulator